ncbi:MAG: TetR/AcrR family transcriptional regulator [Lentisphaeria bacterium]|nr:TetR/AcrR family transcriptional regulator [Lentisphaeria bacterium]
MDLSKRQKEIIDAAVSLIAKNGIEGLTTKALAASVGISEPALYRHFANKAEIIRAMIACFDDDLENLQNNQSGWQFIKAFFAHRIERVRSEPALANIIYSEELFIHNSEYADLMKKMMQKHRNMIMDNIVIAVKQGIIRSDIAPEMVFRMLAGSLRLLIKQYGMSGNAFDLYDQSNSLFHTWDVLFKIK